MTLALKALPLGTRIQDRYQIVSVLGEGGLGVVYQVIDRQNPMQKVALKTMRLDRTDPHFSKLLKREFHTLMALSHPHVAQVFDFGMITEELSSNFPFYFFTSEFFSGDTFSEAMALKSRDVLLRSLLQLFQALDFLHANKVIHRDLKSNNILVGFEGVNPFVKILDFGLAVDGLLTNSGERFGTLPYMAPEVISGESFDLRSDFYSVGVMLYDHFTHRYPYPGECVEDLKQAHANFTLVPPRQITPNLDADMERFILKLMAVKPEQRFFNAEQVLQAVDAMLSGGTAAHPLVEPNHFFVSPKFIGRQKERQKLTAFFSQWLGEREKTACVFLGKTGEGKSTLLNHAKNYLQINDFKTIIIRPHTNHTADQLSHAILSGLTQDSAQTQTFKKDFFEQMILQLQKVRAQGYRGIAVLVDNLHHLTVDALKFFHQIAFLAFQRRSPLLLVGTFNREQEQPGEVKPHAFEIDEWLKSECFAAYAVAPLSEDEIADYLHLTLGIDDPNHSLIFQMKKMTGGNVALLKEITQQVNDVFPLEQRNASAIENLLKNLKPAKTVYGTLAIQAKNLLPLDRAILQVMSIWGMAIEARKIFEVMRLILPKESDVELILDRCEVLCQKELIRCQVTPSGNFYEFHHDLWSNYFYDSIEQKVKVDLHAQCAKVLQVESISTEWIGEIAEHWMATGDTPSAKPFVLKAAEHFAGRGDLDRSIRLYESILPFLEKDEALTVGLEASRLCYLVGDMSRLSSIYDFLETVIRTHFSNSNIETRFLRDKAEMLHLLLQPDAALACVARAEMILEKNENAIERIRLSWTKGRIFFRQAKFSQMLEDSEKNLALANDLELKEEEAELLYNRGLAKAQLQTPDVGIADLQRSADTFEELGNKRKQALALNGVGYFYQQMGQFEQAKEHYQKAYDFAVSGSEKRFLINYMLNLATVFQLFQQYEKALHFYEMALGEAEQNQQRGEKVKVLKNLGNIFMVFGYFEKAKRYLSRAKSIAIEMNLALETAYIDLFSADIELEHENWRAALSLFQKTLREFSKMNHVRSQMDALHGLALSHLGLSEFSEAKRFLEEGNRVCEQLDSASAWLVTHLRWAMFFLKQDFEIEARRHLRLAFESAEEDRSAKTLWNLWVTQATVESRFGQAETARDCFQRAEGYLLEFANHIPEEFRHFYFARPTIKREKGFLTSPPKN